MRLAPYRPAEGPGGGGIDRRSRRGQRTPEVTIAQARPVLRRGQSAPAARPRPGWEAGRARASKPRAIPVMRHVRFGLGGIWISRARIGGNEAGGRRRIGRLRLSSDERIDSPSTADDARRSHPGTDHSRQRPASQGRGARTGQQIGQFHGGRCHGRQPRKRSGMAIFIRAQPCAVPGAERGCTGQFCDRGPRARRYSRTVKDGDSRARRRRRAADAGGPSRQRPAGRRATTGACSTMAASCLARSSRSKWVQNSAGGRSARLSAAGPRGETLRAGTVVVHLRR
jgi:hypothetical protein